VIINTVCSGFRSTTFGKLAIVALSNTNWKLIFWLKPIEKCIFMILQLKLEAIHAGNSCRQLKLQAAGNSRLETFKARGNLEKIAGVMNFELPKALACGIK
jgi:hypothetical protein